MKIKSITIGAITTLAVAGIIVGGIALTPTAPSQALEAQSAPSFPLISPPEASEPSDAEEAADAPSDSSEPMPPNESAPDELAERTTPSPVVGAPSTDRAPAKNKSNNDALTQTPSPEKKKPSTSVYAPTKPAPSSPSKPVPSKPVPSKPSPTKPTPAPTTPSTPTKPVPAKPAPTPAAPTPTQPPAPIPAPIPAPVVPAPTPTPPPVVAPPAPSNNAALNAAIARQLASTPGSVVYTPGGKCLAGNYGSFGNGSVAMNGVIAGATQKVDVWEISSGTYGFQWYNCK